MPRLVHFAPASRARAIEHAGLRARRAVVPAANGTRMSLERAVFAMPVLPDFHATHQWVRELRRWHDERVVAVHFDLSRDEIVWMGRYDKPHASRSLSRAIRDVRANPLGVQIVVPRSIVAREIVAIRNVPQLVGWIEAPEIRTHYDCVCVMCLPPGIPDGFRRVRAAYLRWIDAARAAHTLEEVVSALGRLDIVLERARGRISPTKLLPFTKSEFSGVRRAVAQCFASFRRADVEAPLVALARDADDSVALRALESLTTVAGIARAVEIALDASPAVRAGFAEQLEFARDERGAAMALESLVHDREHAVRSAARAALVRVLRESTFDEPLRARLEALLVTDSDS